MAASPIAPTSAPVSSRSYSRRPPLALTPRRLAANRRNAGCSTGPRTPSGKARVGRNAIKHGFFVAPARWTERGVWHLLLQFLLATLFSWPRTLK